MNEGNSSKEPRLSGYDLEERTTLLGEAGEANELHLIFSKIRRTTLDRP